LELILLDSSVLIAILNPADRHHQIAIDSYQPKDQYLISALSLTEVLPAAIRAGTGEAVMGKLAQITKEAIALTAEIAQAAATIRATGGLKTPDAIISATAAAYKAQLWTFDSKLAKAHKGARLLA
jgi:predicted nucleic acid-binding protein